MTSKSNFHPVQQASEPERGGSLPRCSYSVRNQRMINIAHEEHSELLISSERPPWYAVRTRSNCEKIAALSLKSKGYEQYLPLYRRRRRQFDRILEAEVPLFPGYVFCRPNPDIRFPIVATPGVVSIVGFGHEPMPVPDVEIEAVRTVLHSGLAAEPYPFLLEGRRVRVVYGALRGVEGILIKRKNESRIVVSVTMLQRSISVEVDAASVIAV